MQLTIHARQSGTSGITTAPPSWARITAVHYCLVHEAVKAVPSMWATAVTERLDYYRKTCQGRLKNILTFTEHSLIELSHMACLNLRGFFFFFDSPWCWNFLQAHKQTKKHKTIPTTWLPLPQKNIHGLLPKIYSVVKFWYYLLLVHNSGKSLFER